MSETIYILVSDDTDKCGGTFTIMKASFDHAALEKEAAVLNTDFRRLCDLYAKVLREVQRRNEQGGDWYEHRTAVMKEMVPEKDHQKIDSGNFGVCYTIISTQLSHHGTERTKTGSAPDDTQ